MPREEGTFGFSATLERKKAGNLDASKYFPSYADLLDPEQHSYPYNQMVVEVDDADPALAGLYQLKDWYNIDDPASWIKVGSANGGVDLSNYYTRAQVEALIGKRFAILVVADEDGQILFTPARDITDSDPRQHTITLNGTSLEAGLHFTIEGGSYKLLLASMIEEVKQGMRLVGEWNTRAFEADI